MPGGHRAVPGQGCTIEHVLKAPRANGARLVLAFVCGLLPVACGEVGTGPLSELPAPDRDRYEREIQPIVALRCGSRACHGAVARSLALYSVAYHRARPEGAGEGLDEAALAAEELDANYDALRYRMAGASSAEETRLLRKVLPPGERGGVGHGADVVVFPTVYEPHFRAFSGWVASAFGGQ